MPQANVVHLLQRWGETVPPSDLRVGGPMRAATRAVLAILLTAASAAVVFLVWILWTEETPGWWFSLLFTVMLVGMGVIAWAVYAAAIRSGAERVRAQALWSGSLGQVRQTPATVVAREVATFEDGSVSQFELTVTGGLSGVWRPQRGSSRGLLQNQVPGVGATVRVWQAAGAPAEHPVVIEALDPSVVPGLSDEGVAKYAG